MRMIVCVDCGVEAEKKNNSQKLCPTCRHERTLRSHREYGKRPEIRERRRRQDNERNKKPEVRERMREYLMEYRKIPAVKQRKRERDRERAREETLTTIKRIASAMQTKDPQKGNT